MRTSRAIPVVLLALHGALGLGCDHGGGDGGGDTCSVARVEAPLFGASTDPLGLELRERNAVVALTQSAEGALAGLCSGVLIAPRRVLTARHCAELLPAEVSAYVGPSVGQHVFESAVLRFDEHSGYDVAIAELETAVPGELATPLEPIEDADDIDVGALGTLVGYGLTESDGLGTRLFVQEPITEINDDFVTVDGRGLTGACVGDSGGPLLVRDELGRHRIVGVLSMGEASCLGIDLYQRLEPVRAWLGLDDC